MPSCRFKVWEEITTERYDYLRGEQERLGGLEGHALREDRVGAEREVGVLLGGSEGEHDPIVVLDSGLGGSPVSGRGAVVTNRPLFNPTAFDKTRFEGDLPPGWVGHPPCNGLPVYGDRAKGAGKRQKRPNKSL